MKVEFTEPSGKRIIVRGDVPISLKDLAKANNIQGIAAECGGMCACATCHVYIDPAWVDRLSPLSDIEDELLESTELRRPNSRLSCQIILDSTLDGLLVKVPKTQY